VAAAIVSMMAGPMTSWILSRATVM
jgi:hypothetical protein